MKKSYFLLVIPTVMVIGSCRKKILEIQPVIEITQTMSLPESGSLKHFAFPSDDIGFAALEYGKLYMTIDGGKTWTLTSITTCKGIEFFDTKHGICLKQSSIMATADGGLTWIATSSADYIGKTTDGKAVAVSNNGNTCSVKISTDMGMTFVSAGSIPIDGILQNVSIAGSSVFATGDEAYYYDRLYGLNLASTGGVNVIFDNLIFDENPTGGYIYGNIRAIVGGRGFIGEIKSDDYCFRNHYGHSKDFYSVTGYNDVVIAFGNNTVVTNLGGTDDIPWLEVVDLKGNSFKYNFVNAKFENESTILLGTSDGILLKGKI